MVAVLKLIPYIGTRLADLFESAENWNYTAVGSQEFITSGFHIQANYPVELQTLDVVREFRVDLYHEDFSSFAAAQASSRAADTTAPWRRRGPPCRQKLNIAHKALA